MRHTFRVAWFFVQDLSLFFNYEEKREVSKRPHTRVLLSTKARFEKRPTTRRVFWSARNEYHLDHHPHDTLPFVPLLFGCPSRLRSREIEEEEEEKRVASCLGVVWLR